jgi:uncharacterized protein YkwD
MMRSNSITLLAVLVLPMMARGADPAPAPAKAWHNVSNQPGWQGYGAVNAHGWLEPEYFRRIGNPQEAQPIVPAQTPTQPSTTSVAAGLVATIAPPQPVTYAAQTTVVYGDPYGFVNWLNATRAQYGLRSVGYDQNLTNWAAQNNAQQNARGMGHFIMGPARRQNSAMGNYASIGAMWMASPAHRAALLDPTISFVGVAGAGAYWTFNAY